MALPRIRILDVLAAFSLILCVLIAYFWARSTGGAEISVYLPPRTSVTSAQQFLQLATANLAAMAAQQATARALAAATPQPVAGTKTVIVSMWLPVALLALLPLMWVLFPLSRKFRCAVRVRRHLCPNCCYDVRATPDRCPECGMELKRASSEELSS